MLTTGSHRTSAAHLNQSPLASMTQNPHSLADSLTSVTEYLQTPSQQAVPQRASGRLPQAAWTIVTKLLNAQQRKKGWELTAFIEGCGPEPGQRLAPFSWRGISSSWGAFRDSYLPFLCSDQRGSCCCHRASSLGLALGGGRRSQQTIIRRQDASGCILGPSIGPHSKTVAF